MSIKDKYEKHHRVIYTEEADECVKLSQDILWIGQCQIKIDVMDEAGAATNNGVKPNSIVLLEERKNEIIEKKKKVVLKQKYEEAAKLRDEEDKSMKL
jgi:ATP-dependent Clp protease ATP-binding subunit ClpC